MSIFGLLKKKEKNFDNESKTESFFNLNGVKNIDPDYHKDNHLTKKENKEKNMNNDNGLQMKQFDILVIENDEDGVRQKQVSGVFASSAEELKMLYGAEGSKIKILREYPSQNSISPPVSIESNVPSSLVVQKQVSNPLSQTQSIQPQTVVSQQHIPPKYFEIGGIKCKLENGKMYQEQWVKVDQSKYRLLSETNNKIVSLNGKRIETLKWVLIEDEQNNGESENA